MSFSNPMQMNMSSITPRAAATMVAVEKKLYIFGGRDADGRTNDLHIFDTGFNLVPNIPSVSFSNWMCFYLETRKWVKNVNDQVCGDVPCARSFHTAVSIGKPDTPSVFPFKLYADLL